MTEAVEYNGCFFARVGVGGPCEMRPDGDYDRAHLIPQQRIKHAAGRRGWSAARLGEVLWDKRCYVMACRLHHHRFDISKTIRLTEDQYPPSFKAWAEENGFYWGGPRDGWKAEYQPPEGNAA